MYSRHFLKLIKLSAATLSILLAIPKDTQLLIDTRTHFSTFSFERVTRQSYEMQVWFVQNRVRWSSHLVRRSLDVEREN
jgi:hypothetical protein